jgi:hypothetical protein
MMRRNPATTVNAEFFNELKVVVFDDSRLANHEKYFALLEQTKTVNDLSYVGPREKEQFIGFRNRRLRDKKLVQQPGIASAHVDAVQTRIKNNYRRNPLAMAVFNEEICTLLKKKIKGSVTRLEDLTIRFACNGEVTLKDTQEILESPQRQKGISPIAREKQETQKPQRLTAAIHFKLNSALNSLT